MILVGSVVGSGEIILTTTLGATVGFVMLWWMLLSCWGKSIVQAELGRYAVSSGQTALAAFNDIPGKFPFFRSKMSWFILLWFLQQIPGLLGGGGIYEERDRQLSMMMPFLDSRWWTIVVAIVTATLILSGNLSLPRKVTDLYGCNLHLYHDDVCDSATIHRICDHMVRFRGRAAI